MKSLSTMFNRLRFLAPGTSARSESRSNYISSSGATLLEFCIVFPVFILFVLAIIDFSRYLAVQGILTNSSQRAASLAATIEGLDVDDSTSSDYTTAYEAVKTESLALMSGFISKEPGISMQYINEPPQIIVPEIAEGESRRQLMMNVPIEVRMTATVVPLLPFLGPLRVESSTFAYREPRQLATLPIKTDCNNNPQGSANYDKQDCPCGNYAWWDNSIDECRCMGNLIGDPNIECGCEENYQLVASTNTAWCHCGLTNEQCGVGQAVNTNECKCVCDASKGFIGTAPDCSCAEGFTVKNGACRCAADCPENYTQNPDDCSCHCPSPFSERGGACTCAEGTHQQGSSCICNAPEPPCQGGQVQDPVNCACQCPSPCPAEMTQDSTSCDCTCTSDKKVVSGESCICDPALACPDTWVMNPEDCMCECPSGTSDHGGVCECTGDNQELVNGECQCRETACASNQNFDQQTCACVCTTGFSPTQNGGCECSNTNHVDQGDGTCACPSNLPECGSGQTRNSETCACECPTGSTANGTECTCDNPNSRFENGQCVCETIACASNEVFDQETCTCVCSNDFSDGGSGDCVCKNSNHVDQGNGTCACPTNLPECSGGSVRNTETCACDCPSDSSWDGSACVCSDSARELVGGSCECITKASDCPDNSTYSSTSCTCTCNTGFVEQGETCGCADANKEVSGSSCVCRSDLPDCEGSLVRNTDTCTCTCLGDKVQMGTECLCPAGQVEESAGSNECKCPTSCLARATQLTNCTCACASGYTYHPDHGCLHTVRCLANRGFPCGTVLPNGECSDCPE